MVPMRKIFEALNAKVDWDDTTHIITATKDNTQIVLQINNSTMYNNGVAEALDVAPIIVNSNSGGSSVYRTPSGKRYHFDPNCGGKNSYQTTLQKAKSAGLTPCKKCAW